MSWLDSPIGFSLIKYEKNMKIIANKIKKKFLKIGTEKQSIQKTPKWECCLNTYFRKSGKKGAEFDVEVKVVIEGRRS